MARTVGLLRNAPPGTRGFRYDGHIWCPACLSAQLHVPARRLPDRDMQRPVTAGICDMCGRRLELPWWRSILHRHW